MAENKSARKNYLFYTSDNKKTAFGKLPGHYQGAILNEANIQLRGYQLSNTYKEMANTPENEMKILSHFCEKYANDEKKYKELAIKASQEIFRYPLTKDRDEHRERCARAVSRQIDARAKSEHTSNKAIEMLISKTNSNQR